MNADESLLGRIYNPKGLNLWAVAARTMKTGSVCGTPNCRDITNEELLTLDVDILVPAALGGTITMDNVESVKARIVAEAANAPVTPEAERESFSSAVPS